MIPNLKAALAGRFKFVEEASQIESATGTGRGLSDGIRSAGAHTDSTVLALALTFRSLMMPARRFEIRRILVRRKVFHRLCWPREPRYVIACVVVSLPTIPSLQVQPAISTVFFKRCT